LWFCGSGGGWSPAGGHSGQSEAWWASSDPRTVYTPASPDSEPASASDMASHTQLYPDMVARGPRLFHAEKTALCETPPVNTDPHTINRTLSPDFGWEARTNFLNTTVRGDETVNTTVRGDETGGRSSTDHFSRMDCLDRVGFFPATNPISFFSDETTACSLHTSLTNMSSASTQKSASSPAEGGGGGGFIYGSYQHLSISADSPSYTGSGGDDGRGGSHMFSSLENKKYHEDHEVHSPRELVVEAQLLQSLPF
jgi:hypothetical protein